jgi:uncharacterized protein (DUF2141 family)
MLTLAAGALAGAATAAGSLTVTVVGLRSAQGQVVACLTAQPQTFPDCDRDPAARAVKVPAGTTVELDFGEVQPGRYAISLFHDENGNGRLDKRLMMPREGYGFSRDAPVVMGPPSFAKAAFPVDGHAQHQSIRMRYLF